MSIYTTIQTLLDSHLAELTTLPPLQLENTRNIGKTGMSFTRATLMPARSTQISLGIAGHDRYDGLYQVDLFVPEDTGTTDINILVDSVLDQFLRGLQLVDGDILVRIGNSWREAGGRVEPFYNVPITIEWTYFK
jgi:hypothetical protein